MQGVPIFPLNAVLFPGGRLSLKVFEQRYVEMTKCCLRDNTPFGVCLIREGIEVGTPAVPAETGCLASIGEWDMPQPGIFQLLVSGGERFSLLEHHVAPNGLIVGEIKILKDEPMASAVDVECRALLELVIDRMGVDVFPAPHHLDDSAWVSFRLAEVLPLDLALRQQVLETENGDERSELLKRLIHLLQSGSPAKP